VYLNGQPKCPMGKIDETDFHGPCMTADQCHEGQTCGADKQCVQRLVFTLWGNIACLDETNEPHDGRIRPVFE
jgi:hypothetical protein